MLDEAVTECLSPMLGCWRWMRYLSAVGDYCPATEEEPVAGWMSSRELQISLERMPARLVTRTEMMGFVREQVQLQRSEGSHAVSEVLRLVACAPAQEAVACGAPGKISAFPARIACSSYIKIRAVLGCGCELSRSQVVLFTRGDWV